MKEKYIKLLHNYEIYRTYNELDNMNIYYSWYDLKIYVFNNYVLIYNSFTLPIVINNINLLKKFIEKYRYYQIKKESELDKLLVKKYTKREK